MDSQKIKSEIPENSELIVAENVVVQTTPKIQLSLSDLANIDKKEEALYPFKKWSEIEGGKVICEIVEVGNNSFKCIAHNVKTNKKTQIKLSTPSMLKKQLQSFALEECLNANQNPRLLIEYLGEKDSYQHVGQKYHKFIVKYFNEAIQSFQTSFQFLSWLENHDK
jgi:hypothetical protein